MLDAIADPDDEMTASSPTPTVKQPWDQPKYRISGGTPATLALASILPAFPANLRKQLKGAPMPTPRNILAAAVEGAQVDFDTALRIEGHRLERAAVALDALSHG